MEKKFSLIVATVNREKELNELFRSLFFQSLPDFEVIVVDQNKDDRVERAIRNFPSLKIKTVKCEAKGASHARNRGIECAKGEILGFPDDDCSLPFNLLEEVEKKFNAHRVDSLIVNAIDPFDGNQFARLASVSKEVTGKDVFNCVVEFAIFIKSNALGSVRFDERLGVGSALGFGADEGPDFVMKLLETGKKITYSSDLFYYHEHPAKQIKNVTLKRSFNYGMGRGAALYKHDFPLTTVAYQLIRALGGVLIYCLNPIKSLYFLFSFLGRIKGFFTARNHFRSDRQLARTQKIK